MMSDIFWRCPKSPKVLFEVRCPITWGFCLWSAQSSSNTMPSHFLPKKPYIDKTTGWIWEKKKRAFHTSTMNVTLGRRYFCHLQCKQINGNSSVQLLETFVSDLLKAPQIQCCPPIFLPKKTYIDKTVGWIWEKKKRAFHTIAQWMSH